MKGFLLDTNVILFALGSPTRLPAPVRELLEGGTIHLSVLSYWEVLLKTMKAKLNVGDPHFWWLTALDRLNARPLALRGEHISEILSLPDLHQDPFDRGLIAQAMFEQLTFVTADETIVRYSSERFHVLAAV